MVSRAEERSRKMRMLMWSESAAMRVTSWEVRYLVLPKICNLVSPVQRTMFQRSCDEPSEACKSEIWICSCSVSDLRVNVLGHALVRLGTFLNVFFTVESLTSN